MKTAKLIALIGAFVFVAILFRAEETTSEVVAQAGQATQFTTDVSSQSFPESARDMKRIGLTKVKTGSAAIWLVFGLLASGLGLVRLLRELKRAPEGYEDETGFHLRIPRAKRTDRTRRGRRGLAHSSVRWVPRPALGGR
jgi:hypothetical protein